MKKAIITIFLAAILVSLIHPDWNFAQNTRLSIQNQLRKLEEQYRYAEEIVTAYGDQKAKTHLRQANQLYKQAVKFYQADKLTQTVTTIRIVRNHLDTAIRLTLAKSGNRLAEQLSELIRRAEQAVINCRNKEADRLLIQAKQNQEKGLREVRQSQIAIGLEHLRIANFLAEKVVKLCDGKKIDIEDDVRNERQRFEELLERAQQAVEATNNRNARDNLSKAISQAQQADKALFRREFKRALDHYYNAAKLLWRSIELAKPNNRISPNRLRDHIEKELILLDASIEQLRDKISTAPPGRAKFLYQRSLKLRSEAQLALNASRFRIARKKVEMAQNAVRRALGLLGRPNSRAADVNVRAEKELNRLEEKIQELEQDASLKGKPQAKKLLKTARQNANAARRAISKTRYSLGLERILVAHQFLHWVEQMRSSAPSPQVSPEKIQTQIHLFDQLYEQSLAEIEKSMNKFAQKMLQEALHFRERAEKALQKNELYFALANIESAHQLLLRSKQLSRL